MITNSTAVRTVNVMLQNGVVDGSPLIPMGPSRGSHGDGPKRPSKLSVITSKVCLARAVQEDSQGMEDGSLPCTPEMHPADGLPAREEAAIDSNTRDLMSQTMADLTKTGRDGLPRKESKALSTMKRVVGGLMEKHRYVYKGMAAQLSLDDREDVSFISSVAKNIFADGVSNWGRIASLVAFGAVVAQHMKDNGRTDCVEQVAQQISQYLLTDRRDWLIQNNGWEGFVEFFQVSDPESTVRNMLMAVAGVAGLGATLALLIR